MKSTLVALTLVALIAMTGCGQPDVEKRSAMTPTQSSLAEIGFAVANPVEEGNVKLIPIISKRTETPTPSQDLTTLDEAKKEGTVVITEADDIGYNGVRVTNNGKKPLLLLAGELVLGGHQDRLVARDTIIQPGKTQDIEVFCVEEGRSTGPTDEFKPSSQPAPHKVRRDAIFAKDQNAVWGSVSNYNASAAAAPPTETVRGGLESEQVATHVQRNAQTLIDRMADVPNAVGYVLVIDGRIDSAEVFGAEKLFRRMAPQLIRSVLAQQATKITTSPKNMSEGEVERFLLEALSGRRLNSNSTVENDRAYGQRQRRAGAAAIDGSYDVKAKQGIQGYEIYGKTEGQSKSSPGSLVHGTYAKP